MGKVNTQLPVMCGACKNFFANEKAATDHINAKHQGRRVGVYSRTKFVDLREDDEPSMADRQIAAMLAVSMGEYTDDEWLLP
ncbi:hypothetical protein [Ensifer sp. LC163]|uniref:hypothetical protein n=1 Tax=Ensifer sp. LC163 TaxID=1120652 RepID=UPI000813AF5A|nr:hypothetical protein [Ensifer sp. LC163]OCP36759.1 hypothetical protein BC360_05245 [Ensifer sp. LC163]